MQRETAEEVREWLEKAALDVRCAEVDLAVEPPLTADALFHCQQAVEKALKGFLAAHGRRFGKTHDLDVLSRDCEKQDPSLQSLLAPARDLSVYAWVFRYPGSTGTPSRGEAENALAVARSIYEAVSGRVT